MLLEGQGQVLGIDAAAVVGHPDKALPSLCYLNQNPARTGVNGVFHQLLDHRCRPLYDLASSDLVDGIGVEKLNPDHFHPPPPPLYC